jgi:hypothetical protein
MQRITTLVVLTTRMFLAQAFDQQFHVSDGGDYYEDCFVSQKSLVASEMFREATTSNHGRHPKGEYPDHFEIRSADFGIGLVNCTPVKSTRTQTTKAPYRNRKLAIQIDNKTQKQFSKPEVALKSGSLLSELPLVIEPGQSIQVRLSGRTASYAVTGVICYRYMNEARACLSFEVPHLGPNVYSADIVFSKIWSIDNLSIESMPFKVYDNKRLRKTYTNHNVFALGTEGGSAWQRVIFVDNVDRVVRLSIVNDTPIRFTPHVHFMPRTIFASDSDAPSDIPAHGNATVIVRKELPGENGILGTIGFKYGDGKYFYVYFENPYSEPNRYAVKTSSDSTLGQSVSEFANMTIGARINHFQFEPDFNVALSGTKGNQANQTIVITENRRTVNITITNNSTETLFNGTIYFTHGMIIGSLPDKISPNDHVVIAVSTAFNSLTGIDGRIIYQCDNTTVFWISFKSYFNKTIEYNANIYNATSMVDSASISLNETVRRSETFSLRSPKFDAMVEGHAGSKGQFFIKLLDNVRTVTVTIENQSNTTLLSPNAVIKSGMLSDLIPLQIVSGEKIDINVAMKPGEKDSSVLGIIGFRYNQGDQLIIFFSNPFIGIKEYWADLVENTYIPFELYLDRIQQVKAGQTTKRFARGLSLEFVGSDSNRATMRVIIREEPIPITEIDIPERTRTRKTNFGMFLKGLNTGQVIVTKTLDSWCLWQWTWLGENRLHWKSIHGTFLMTNKNKDVFLGPGGNDGQLWYKEGWELNNCWRSHYGGYLSSDENGTVFLAPTCDEATKWND